jgi:hypothetical protein
LATVEKPADCAARRSCAQSRDQIELRRIMHVVITSPPFDDPIAASPAMRGAPQ